MQEYAQAAWDISLHIHLFKTVEVVTIMTDFNITYPYKNYKYRQEF
jgi:hypothetical protein